MALDGTSLELYRRIGTVSEKKARRLRRLVLDREVFLEARRDPKYTINVKTRQVRHKVESTGHFLKFSKRLNKRTIMTSD